MGIEAWDFEDGPKVIRGIIGHRGGGGGGRSFRDFGYFIVPKGRFVGRRGGSRSRSRRSRSRTVGRCWGSERSGGGGRDDRRRGEGGGGWGRGVEGEVA